MNFRNIEDSLPLNDSNVSNQLHSQDQDTPMNVHDVQHPFGGFGERPDIAKYILNNSSNPHLITVDENETLDEPPLYTSVQKSEMIAQNSKVNQMTFPRIETVNRHMDVKVQKEEIQNYKID